MKVTSFADVSDLLAYNRALDNGMSPHQALNVGDNGLGAWNQSTVAGTGPCFAVSRKSGALRNRKAVITVKGKTVTASCRDIAPSGVIDLNPDACSALGLKPPVLEKGTLKWVDETT